MSSPPQGACKPLLDSQLAGKECKEDSKPGARIEGDDCSGLGGILVSDRGRGLLEGGTQRGQKFPL